MRNLKNIVDDLFLVEKDLSKEALKIFYNVDINIHNPSSELPPQPITNTTNVVAQAPEVVQKQKNESTRNRIANILLEDDPNNPTQAQIDQPVQVPQAALPAQQPAPQGKDFVKKASGELTVSRDEVGNIQTLEDILDFIGDKKEKAGTPIMDEISVELVLAMCGANDTSLESIVKKEDKVIIEINYGNKRDDCIGFKVLKRSGVNNVSIVMLKDGEILDGPFDLKTYNAQLVLFRNSVMGGIKK